VKLYGHLAKKFGKEFNFAVHSPKEAIKALAANFSNFLTELKDGTYHIFVEEEDISIEDVDSPTGTRTIRIVPVVFGSKGFFKVVLGVALVALAFALPVTAPALLVSGLKTVGMSLIFGGVSEMLFGGPQNLDSPEPVDSRPSSLFQGAVNTVAQGGPVPVGYGRLIVGSTVIGASITTKDI